MNRKLFLKLTGFTGLLLALDSCRKYTGDLFDPIWIKETITEDKTNKLINMANVAENFRNSGRVSVSSTTSLNGFNGCEPLESILTTRVKSTFDGVKLTGKSTIQIEIGMVAVMGHFVLQVGYRKAGSRTVPFTDYSNPDPMVITPLNGGTGPFYTNAKNTFEVYKYAPAIYRYRRNGVDIVQYELLTDVDIKDMNVHTLVIGGGKIPVVNFYPALQYDSGGNYINAVAGRNIYGASDVGFEGQNQNGSLNLCELNAGSTIAKTAYGDLLWGTV